MSPVTAAVVVLGLIALGVYLYARKRVDEQATEQATEEVPTVTRSDDEWLGLSGIKWWESVWGASHRMVAAVPPPYDWEQDRPAAVVGSGRGRAI